MKKSIIYILFIFLVCSILGGLLETFYLYFLYGSFNISNFMYGPWRPIYGYGAVVLYLITNKFKNDNVTVFFVSIIVCSLFEYISSFLLEVVFHQKFWDYSLEFLNLNGRICLVNSLLWGVLALLFKNILEPCLNKIFNSYKFKNISLMVISLFILHHIDGIFSWIKNLK